MIKSAQFACLSLVSLIATGCANSGSSYQPVVDGARGLAYEQDLNSCQTTAKQLKYFNGDVKSETTAGAVVGAVIGGIADGGSGIIGGAAIGALATGPGRAWEVRDERKAIVIKCMEKRGHNVVG